MRGRLRSPGNVIRLQKEFAKQKNVSKTFWPLLFLAQPLPRRKSLGFQRQKRLIPNRANVF